MKKLLVYVITYNHESIIKKTLERIPKELSEKYETEILVSDDFSTDNTCKEILEYSKNCKDFKITFIRTSQNLGYGGNQKLGYLYAINNKFDIVALIHGDGQYAPESLSNLLEPFNKDFTNTFLVIGSRMINKKDAIKGGMPLYKFFGNILLTKIQNIMLRTKLHEFHSGYKIYKVECLKNINFMSNSNNFHFDTEIIIQFLLNNYKICEIPIKTFYGNEVSNVNSFFYAFNCIKTILSFRLAKMGIFYDLKYLNQNLNLDIYQSKLDFMSTHSLTFERIKKDSRILDLGGGEGYVSKELELKKNCKVVVCDNYSSNSNNTTRINMDLNKDLVNSSLDWNKFDYILLLDVIEHLDNPEKFLKNLNLALISNKNIKLIVSTGNIAFLPLRLMLLFGFFNYGPKGILDITHKRLFTFNSFKKLFHDNGFRIIKTKGIPPPYPLVFGKNYFSLILLKLNNFFIKISKNLFSYQIYYEVIQHKNIYREYKEIKKNKLN